MTEHDEKLALEIFGDPDHTILDYMVTSGGSIEFTPANCERCEKKFRFYRKEHLIFDGSEHRFHSWKLVCIDCINLETDVYFD